MTGRHARNTGAMQSSPRCGARTRNGQACHAPAMRSKLRCRMHGGALRCGAPTGNGNAYKHGLFTKDAIAEQRQVQVMLDEARKLLREVK